jgi:hypothetical protein
MSAITEECNPKSFANFISQVKVPGSKIFRRHFWGEKYEAKGKEKLYFKSEIKREREER